MTARPTWEELPDDVINAVEEQVGHVLKAETVTGGIMPGLAARLDTETGEQVFLKAIERTHEGAQLHLRERRVGYILPKEAPGPRMLWGDTIGTWHVMLWEYVNDHSQHADLTPSSADLMAVLDTIALLSAIPCPAGALPVSENIVALLAKGRHMLGKSVGMVPNRAQVEAALDGFDPDAFAGDTLVHYDLSASNLLVTGKGKVRVVDWSFAVRGAAWLDAALFAPRLIQAGHAPGKADIMLATLPHWHSAPREAVVGLAAAWSLFRLYKARFGPLDVREARAAAAEAGFAWMAYQQAKG